MSKMMNDIGRLSRGVSTATGPERYVPGSSYSYGMAGSKANLLDKRGFVDEFTGSSAKRDLFRMFDEIDRRNAVPYNRNALYWGPSTDLGERFGSPMRNLGRLSTALALFGALEFLDEYIQGTGWWKVGPAGFVTGRGWSRCANPTPSCEATWPPTHQIASVGSPGVCPPYGTCPTGQFTAWPQPAIGTAVASSINVLTYILPTSVINPSLVFASYSAAWVRDVANQGEATGPYSAGHTVPLGGVAYRPVSEDDPTHLRGRVVAAFPFGDTVTVPSKDIVVGGSGPPKGQDGTHTKEPDASKKINMPYSMALRLYHALTEVNDAVECLYKALSPEGKGHIKPKKSGGSYGQVEYGQLKRTPLQQARQVAMNLDKIDWVKATQCLVYNEVEDRVVGRAFGLLGNVAKKGGPSTTQMTNYLRQMRGR